MRKALWHSAQKSKRVFLANDTTKIRLVLPRTLAFPSFFSSVIIADIQRIAYNFFSSNNTILMCARSVTLHQKEIFAMDAARREKKSTATLAFPVPDLPRAGRQREADDSDFIPLSLASGAEIITVDAGHVSLTIADHYPLRGHPRRCVLRRR